MWSKINDDSNDDDNNNDNNYNINNNIDNLCQGKNNVWLLLQISFDILVHINEFPVYTNV